MCLKRQRLMDQGSSYYGTPPEAEIADFFHGLDIVDVLFVHKGGKFPGAAYCVLGYPLQIDFALQRNRLNIGRIYVEVFLSRKDEYYKAIANEVFDAQAGKDDIIDFFKNFTLSEDSIHITHNYEGKPTGAAFVEFASVDDTKAALSKDSMTLVSRYIELFPSLLDEMNEAVSRGW
ncbi:heterogeneous nuclear ribonucleo F [Olea europaea subsp. europaea]|uniref:Heterogeneous nuclear ribonucleo F n=1 Tax=Olea europaea subsp. europaea TaxID=158383 RepID=A0A8S0RJ11_OLEEU|nr:heterogeneous nuclear ribonucleo F [Olea europaea subsp. europaea]